MDDDDYYYYEDEAYNDYGDVEETWETPLQIKYDDAKASIEANPDVSIGLLKEVIAEDVNHGLWTFKCLKKLARASRNAKRYDEMIEYQQQFLSFSSPEVDDSLKMKGATKFMDKVPRLPVSYQERAIATTLAACEENRGVYGKLWFQTMLRRATMLLDANDDAASIAVLEEARAWCGEPAHVSGNEPQVCQLYALLLQAYTRTGQFTLAREAYFSAMRVDTANGAPVPQRTIAAVLEWGGHMYLRQADWHAAYRAFHAAFRMYSEAGNPAAASTLKFAVVADMICGDPVDSFAANEGKASAASPTVQPIVRLLHAFLRTDVAAAVALVQDARHREVFIDDALMAPYVEPLLFRLRLNALVKYVTSFTTVSLADVASKLCMDSVEETADFCTFAILQRLIVASVDDTTSMLMVHSTASSTEMRRAEALLQWSTKLLNPSA